MFDSLLIANRGEIACRIIKTARQLGIRTIAVYSEADAGLPFVRQAHQAIKIGPAPAHESYLSIPKILDAAQRTGAAAIHPGYGFLSENAEFAEAVQSAGIIWVGAPPSSIRAMGLKDAAKALMQQAGVAVTPGYIGADQSDDNLQRQADEIGYPVLIKAVAGGGGKGMRRVDGPAEFIPSLTSCRREAAAAFGDERVLLEKYINNPRHIEVQVFADTHGNCVHLFERDCSLQRRHQKVIEEAPAPGMDMATRQIICEAAVKAARAVDYVGAGTIEFIADAAEGLRADRIWFMEMNTRLQVEHPVTEAVTGIDLVRETLRIADGEPLRFSQNDIVLRGAALECRINAEDPEQDFRPNPGRINELVWPTGPGVRIDSMLYQGYIVPPFYDSLLAKLIVFDESRPAALARLRRALSELRIVGIKTTATLHHALLEDDDIRAGRYHTNYLEAWMTDWRARRVASTDLNEEAA
jgi:3-methylcrotonyl-CoA carboxylase alpha subunit